MNGEGSYQESLKGRVACGLCKSYSIEVSINVFLVSKGNLKLIRSPLRALLQSVQGEICMPIM